MPSPVAGDDETSANSSTRTLGDDGWRSRIARKSAWSGLGDGEYSLVIGPPGGR